MADTGLPFRQQIFILIMGILLMLLIVELIRQRKLIEKYAIIWIILGIGAISVVWLYPLIVVFTDFIGAGSTSSTILFAGIFLLLLLNMQLCIKVSDYEYKIKDLVQEIALLHHQLDKNRTEQTSDSETKQS